MEHLFMLCTGNIVGAYSTEGLGIIEAIEPGCVHLSGREFPDDIRDVFGIELDSEWLMRLGFILTGNELWQHNLHKNFVIKSSGKRLDMIVSGIFLTSVHYVHELQNLFAAITHKALQPEMDEEG